MKNLIYLAYGREVEYNRAIFSVLSFWSWFKGDLSKIRVNVYTDNPEYFNPFLQGINVHFVRLNEKILNDMLGGGDYIHRRKVKVIEHTFINYPSDDVLFVDADTFFIANPTEWLNKLKPGLSYMHIKEYAFEKGLELFTSFGQEKEPTDFINYLEQKPLLIGNNLEHFNRKDFCWNSGVIGLTANLAAYIPDVLRVTDELYKNSSWFIAEQIAFSLVLETKTRIFPSNIYVFHYWGKRQKALFDELFKKNIDNIKQNIDEKRYTRSLSQEWKKQIQVDELIEEANNAFLAKSYNYGIKKIIKTLIIDPKSICLVKAIVKLRIKIENSNKI